MLSDTGALLRRFEEQDTQDIYDVKEDAQDRQTQFSITTKTVVSDNGQIQALQARDQTHADDPEGTGSSA
ncbi:hypothetical protein Tco_0822160 [Tanacetum coccineum]|uniref:Uncharacterized protein n=1 Tax=Tanacetum coccineum TaxID=301880 RepID=A0ABQ5AIH3_9ASTR